MSYFAHNPEAWDEIERRGVAAYLAGHMQDDDLLEDLTEALIECQQASESQAAWKELTRLANQFIAGESAAYFSGIADAAMARAEAQS